MRCCGVCAKWRALKTNGADNNAGIRPRAVSSCRARAGACACSVHTGGAIANAYAGSAGSKSANARTRAVGTGGKSAGSCSADIRDTRGPGSQNA